MKEFRSFCYGVITGLIVSVISVIIFGPQQLHPRWGSDEYSFILTIMLATGALFVVWSKPRTE